MKTFILICLMPGAIAHAQTVECPKFYPSKDTVLADAPSQHKGKGVVAQQPLTGAGLNVGEFNGGGDIQGRRQDIKGGYEVHFGSWSGPKWLVCTYGSGNAVSWWEELNSKETDCKLTVLKKKSNGQIDAALACK
jgi:hypothetical protein